jgi:hypothetical protein
MFGGLSTNKGALIGKQICSQFLFQGCVCWVRASLLQKPNDYSSDAEAKST